MKFDLDWSGIRPQRTREVSLTTFQKHPGHYEHLEDAQLAAHTAFEAEYLLAIKARAEDHGLVPDAETSTLVIEMAGGGLARDDPDYLEEEEELLVGMSAAHLPLLVLPDDAEFEHGVTCDMFSLWNLDAIEEYNLGSVLVGHVQLAPVFDEPRPDLPLQPQPVQQPLLQLKDLFKVVDPPRPEFPPPL